MYIVFWRSNRIVLNVSVNVCACDQQILKNFSSRQTLNVESMTKFDRHHNRWTFTVTLKISTKNCFLKNQDKNKIIML